MKNRLRFFGLLACLVLFYAYTQAQPGNWSYIGPNPFYLGGINDLFGDITFADTLTGYATDEYNPRIMKTTDGGATWQMMWAPFPAYICHFVTRRIGWIANSITIAKTMDGGNSWVTQFDTSTLSSHYKYNWGNYIQDLYFLDSLNAYVAGAYYLSKTTDGGNTWISITPWNLDSLWRRVYFMDANTGWALSNDSVLAKTTDGGQTWTAKKIAGLDEYDQFSGIKFYSANAAVIVTRNGFVYKTNDGGDNWSKVPVTIGTDVATVKFGNNSNIYAYDYGAYELYISVDSGNNWVNCGTPAGESVLAFYFLNPLKGFAGRDHIYTTTNGGLSWSSDIPQYPQSYYPVADIAWVSSNHAIATTAGGTIESFDNGINWLLNDTNDILTIQNVDSSCYFVWEPIAHGLARYENGAINYSLPYPYTFLYAESRDSFIVSYQPGGDQYYILRTTNSGQTFDTIFYLTDTITGFYSGGEWWDAENTPYPQSNTFARFMNWNIGVMAYKYDTSVFSPAISNEFVTTNGGATWTTMTPDSNSYIASTKVSPTGQLYCLRASRRSAAYSLTRFDSTTQWRFINFINTGISQFGQQGQPDFGWSWDNVLWSNTANSFEDYNISYSLDNGNSWNTYSLLMSGFTMLKRLPGGKFIGGAGHGELLQYDGKKNNCRIMGNVFFDFNHNGVFDGYDKMANGYPVKVMPGELIAFTGPDGNYITALDSGSYIVSADTFGNFHGLPVSLPVVFTKQTGVSTGNNFALQPIDTSLQDLAVFAFEGCQSDPGFAHTTYIFYANFGVVPVQPTITLQLDSTLAYSNASISPSSVSGNTITWNLPVINPFDHVLLSVNSTLSDSAQLGYLGLNVINILPVTGDANPLNNTDSSYFVVLGSFDPNFKTVSPTTIVANQSRSQSQLQYTISFQNTGTDSTHFILVKDALSPHLNPASLQVLGASLPYDYYFEPGNVLVFRFNNAHLPDSTQDPVGSHGFVSFTISPYASQINTDTVFNSASIYFDYNTPVTTKPSKLVITGAVTDIKPVYGDISLKIFPNPASTIVHVESRKDFQCIVYDLQGRALLTGKSTGNHWILDASKLASGMYILQVTQDGLHKGYSLVVTR